VAGGELDGVGVATRFFGRGAHHAEQVGQLRGRTLAREEAVAQAPGPAGRGFAVAAHHDRHVRRGRAGEAHGPLPPVVAVVEVHLFAGPQGPHGGHVGVGAGAPAGERHTEGVELLFEPAHADPQLHPAAGQPVERGHLLGHDGGVALGQDQDAGAESQGGGGGGHVGEPHQRVGDVERLAAGHATALGVGIGGLVVDRHQHVFDGPHRFEAGGLDGSGDPGRDGALGERSGVGEGDPEAHGRDRTRWGRPPVLDRSYVT